MNAQYGMEIVSRGCPHEESTLCDEGDMSHPISTLFDSTGADHCVVQIRYLLLSIQKVIYHGDRRHQRVDVWGSGHEPGSKLWWYYRGISYIMCRVEKLHAQAVTRN